MNSRHQSSSEEWANSLSHALGTVLALAAWPILSDVAERTAGTRGVVGVAIFIGAMVLTYAISTAYHACPPGRMKLWWRSADHAAIYLFIAGSSTPFTLGLVGGPAGTATCAVIWALALAGAWLKLCRRLTNERLSIGLYVLFGWIAFVLVWVGLPTQTTGTTVLWLAGGGLAYLVGAGFFVLESVRFGHLAWHLCTLAGSGCHLCAALLPAMQ
jgi:hemolysin III